MKVIKSKTFEVVEMELKEAISKNDRQLISNLLDALLVCGEGFINAMPEYIYERYLKCIDEAKVVLK
jgi:hypothetical protein